MALAPPAMKLSIARACKLRGHVSISVVCPTASAASREIPTTATCSGAGNGPRAANNSPSPRPSSRANVSGRNPSDQPAEPQRETERKRPDGVCPDSSSATASLAAFVLHLTGHHSSLIVSLHSQCERHVGRSSAVSSAHTIRSLMAVPPQQVTPLQPCRSRAPRRNAAGTTAIAMFALLGLTATRSCSTRRAAAMNGRPRSSLSRAPRRCFAAAARSGRRLVTGDRVCSGETISVQGASRVAVTLPDETSLQDRRAHDARGPRPAVGQRHAGRASARRDSRDQPRPDACLLFTTPYANAGLEGTEFDIRVDDVARRMEVVVLEGEVVVTNTAGTIGVAATTSRPSMRAGAPSVAPILEPIELDALGELLPFSCRVHTAGRRAGAVAGTGYGSAVLCGPRRCAPRPRRASTLRKRTSTRRCVSSRSNVTALSLQAMLALARADRDNGARSRRSGVAGRAGRGRRSVRPLARRRALRQDLAAAEQSIRAALEVEPEQLARPDQACRARARAGRRTARNRERDTRTRLWLRHAAPRWWSSASQACARSTPRGTSRVRRSRGARAQCTVAAPSARPDADTARRGARRPAATRARSHDGPNESFDAKLHGEDLRHGKPRPAHGDPARSREAIRSSRSDRLAVLRATQSAQQSTGPGSAGPARRHGEKRRSARVPLVVRIGRGRRHEQCRLEPRPYRARFRSPAHCSTRGMPWPTTAPTTRASVARRRVFDAAAARDRARQRVARLPADAARERQPIKPQLAQPDLFISQHVSPASASFDELDSPVLANGLKLRASAVRGGNDTASQDVTLAGLHDQVSYSVGYYDFATDGFRENNDVDQRVASAFIQGRPNHATNLQAEIRSVRTEQWRPDDALRSRRSTRRSYGSTKTRTRSGSVQSNSSRGRTLWSVR